MTDVDFKKQENGDYTAIVKCPFCGNVTKIENVSSYGVFAWRNGAFVQRAFPNMSIEDRECFVSGLCHDCQETMFGGMDCEEEEEEEARANA